MAKKNRLKQKQKQIKENEFQCYCEICGSCGETGCCTATICDVRKKGMYCHTNLAEMKVAYITLNSFLNKLDEIAAVGEVINPNELRDMVYDILDPIEEKVNKQLNLDHIIRRINYKSSSKLRKIFKK